MLPSIFPFALARPPESRNFVAHACAVLVLLVVATLLGWPGAVRAQLPGTVDPGFAPIARPDGAIAVIATQPDGRLILGGSFYRVGSTVSPHVCRLNADGSADPGFVPPADLGQIVHLAVGPDGKTVLIERTDDADPGNYILVRLNADGSRDTGFAPAHFLGSPSLFGLRAFTVAVQADDKVLVEGGFYRPPGSDPSIERFNTDGSLDTTFQFSTHIGTTNLSALLPLSNGQILVGGNSTEYGGQTLVYRDIFRLNADGSVDESYNPDTPGVQNVYALAPQADGKVVYLGYAPQTDSPTGTGFSPTGGVPRRLNADGTADTGFAPQLDSGASLTSLLLQPDGKVLVGGYTANHTISSTDPSLDGSVIQNGVVRLNADGTTDLTFHPAVPLVNNQVNALGLLPDGQVIVGGDFRTVADLPRIGLTRLGADGVVDASYASDLTKVGIAYAVAVEANGLPVVLDSASFANSSATGQLSGPHPALVFLKNPIPSHLASFNPDGSLNTVFPFAIPSSQPGYLNPLDAFFYIANSVRPANSVVVPQTDGKLLVTGDFSYDDSFYTFTQVERFNVDGSIDASFDYFTSPGSYSTTYAVVPQADGKFLVAGNAGFFGNLSYPLTRLNVDGSFDATFTSPTDPGADEEHRSSTFYALASQPDGKAIAGGLLNAVNGQPVADVLRFNTDGSVDTSFNAGVPTEAAAGKTPYVFALALQADGRVVIGGYFSTIGGVPCNNLARLNGDGSLDTSFGAGGLGTDGLVRSIAIQPDGKIVLGGEFTKVNGVVSNGVARLNADGTTDPLFFPGTGTGGIGVVNSVALAPDGRILIGGTFTTFDGQARDGVAELAGGELTAPAITATTATAQVGQAFTYTIPASEQPTGYTATGLPDGLSLLATGVISGVPTVTGTFIVTLSATNLAGVGTGSLTITVNPAAPVVSGGSAAGQAGAAFSYQINASNSPDSYTAAPLPTGLTIDPTTGLISGTPTVTGTFTVSLGATNAGGTGTATLSLTIGATPVAAPVITSGLIASGTRDAAFAYQIVATNGPTRYEAVGLPLRLSVDPATGLISGTPAATGTFTILLSATNAGGAGTATLVITVTAGVPTVTAVAASDGFAMEGSKNGKVAIRRTGDLARPLTVRYKIVGVLADVDYRAMTGFAVIPAGAAQVKIKIKPIDDSVHEGTRVARVKLRPASDGSYTLGSPKAAKVHILDND